MVAALQEPGVVFESPPRLRVGLTILELLPRHVTLLFEQGPQLLVPERLGLVELDAHPAREWLVAGGNLIPEVTDRAERLVEVLCELGVTM
jgi:hypothetical protein